MNFIYHVTSLIPKKLSPKGKVFRYAMIADEGCCVLRIIFFVIANYSPSDQKDLLSELDLLKKLKPHPNVIRLLGCVTKDVVRCKGKGVFRKFNNSNSNKAAIGQCRVL